MENKKPLEDESQKKAVIIYRNNDLFERYIPVVEDSLTSLGYEPVRKQVFPAGTPEEEIKKWYFTHEEELDSSTVLADHTVKEASGYRLKTKINLDDLMSQATTEAITGDATFGEHLKEKVYEDSEKKQEYLSALGEMYKKILNSIPEERRQNLEFVILTGVFRNFPTLIAHEPYCPPRDNFEELSKETNEFADMMKKWFNEAGISNVTVYSTGAEIPREVVRKLIKRGQEAYIIFDRHTATPMSRNLSPEGSEKMKRFWGNNTRYSGSIKIRSALQTPLETFYNDIQRKIGIAADPQKIADPQKMEELVKKRLEERL